MINIKIDFEKKLGEGGYGEVYLCKNASGEKCAIKIIKENRNDGIPCLFEASMMASYSHPNIAKARAILNIKDTLYILSDLALGDLKRWRHKNNPSKKVMQLIMFYLTQATAYLHNKDIIHGDIKAGNILVYSDNTIKLTDFSLTMNSLWDNRDKWMCTSTHRPAEIWLNKNWNEKIDIWALGCTFYELVYNQIPFPYQGQVQHGKKIDRDMMKKSSLNCFYKWGEKNEGNEYLDMKKVYDIEFLLPRYRLEWKNKENRDSIVKLILWMLKIDPKHRPYTDKILNRGFMEDMNKLRDNEIIDTANKVDNISNILDNKNKENIILKLDNSHIHIDYIIQDYKKELINISGSMDIIRHCIILCRKSHNLIKLCLIYFDNNSKNSLTKVLKKDFYKISDYFSLDLIKKTLYWISHKIIYRKPPRNKSFWSDYWGEFTKSQILICEKLICECLAYRLH